MRSSHCSHPLAPSEFKMNHFRFVKVSVFIPKKLLEILKATGYLTLLNDFYSYKPTYDVHYGHGYNYAVIILLIDTDHKTLLRA